jgi:hypothetical protein
MYPEKIKHNHHENRRYESESSWLKTNNFSSESLFPFYLFIFFYVFLIIILFSNLVLYWNNALIPTPVTSFLLSPCSITKWRTVCLLERERTINFNRIMENF